MVKKLVSGVGDKPAVKVSEPGLALRQWAKAGAFGNFMGAVVRDGGLKEALTGHSTNGYNAVHWAVAAGNVHIASKTLGMVTEASAKWLSDDDLAVLDTLIGTLELQIKAASGMAYAQLLETKRGRISEDVPPTKYGRVEKCDLLLRLCLNVMMDLPGWGYVLGTQSPITEFHPDMQALLNAQVKARSRFAACYDAAFASILDPYIGKRLPAKIWQFGAGNCDDLYRMLSQHSKPGIKALAARMKSSEPVDGLARACEAVFPERPVYRITPETMAFLQAPEAEPDMNLGIGLNVTSAIMTDNFKDVVSCILAPGGRLVLMDDLASLGSAMDMLPIWLKNEPTINTQFRFFPVNDLHSTAGPSLLRIDAIHGDAIQVQLKKTRHNFKTLFPQLSSDPAFLAHAYFKDPTAANLHDLTDQFKIGASHFREFDASKGLDIPNVVLFSPAALFQEVVMSVFNGTGYTVNAKIEQFASDVASGDITSGSKKSDARFLKFHAFDREITYPLSDDEYPTIQPGRSRLVLEISTITITRLQ